MACRRPWRSPSPSRAVVGTAGTRCSARMFCGCMVRPSLPHSRDGAWLVPKKTHLAVALAAAAVVAVPALLRRLQVAGAGRHGDGRLALGPDAGGRQELGDRARVQLALERALPPIPERDPGRGANGARRTPLALPWVDQEVLNNPLWYPHVLRLAPGNAPVAQPPVPVYHPLGLPSGAERELPPPQAGGVLLPGDMGAGLLFVMLGAYLARRFGGGGGGGDGGGEEGGGGGGGGGILGKCPGMPGKFLGSRPPVCALGGCPWWCVEVA